MALLTSTPTRLKPKRRPLTMLLQQERFLRDCPVTLNIRASCRRLRCHYTTVYQWLRGDAEFVARLDVTSSARRPGVRTERTLLLPAGKVVDAAQHLRRNRRPSRRTHSRPPRLLAIAVNQATSSRDGRDGDRKQRRTGFGDGQLAVVVCDCLCESCPVAIESKFAQIPHVRIVRQGLGSCEARKWRREVRGSF